MKKNILHRALLSISLSFIFFSFSFEIPAPSTNHPALSENRELLSASLPWALRIIPWQWTDWRPYHIHDLQQVADYTFQGDVEFTKTNKLFIETKDQLSQAIFLNKILIGCSVLLVISLVLSNKTFIKHLFQSLHSNTKQKSQKSPHQKKVSISIRN